MASQHYYLYFTLPNPSCRFRYDLHPSQVPQLVKMIGPDPAKFAGLSPRVDEELGRSSPSVLVTAQTLSMILVLVFILSAKKSVGKK